MKKIFIINGSARSGKDTFVDVVRMWKMTNNSNYYEYPVYNISSVDKVKESAKLLGWDSNKDEKGRKFLSDLKYLSSETYDGPFNYIKIFIEDRNNGIFFLHVREPGELLKITREYPDSITIFIKRSAIEVPNNRADQEVELYNYDLYFENDGTLEDYVKKIHSWCCGTFI